MTTDNSDLKSISDRLLQIDKNCEHQQKILSIFKKFKEEDLMEHTLKTKAKKLKIREDMTRKQRAIPATDENKVAHAARWSSYYIRDYYPLAYATLTLQATVSAALAELIYPEYCNMTYQIVEWSVFAISSLCLAWVAGSSAQNWDDGVKDIVSQWLMFIGLLLSTTSFPPLQCYTESDGYFTGLGTLSLIVVTVSGYFFKVYQAEPVTGCYDDTDYMALQGEDDKVDLDDERNTDQLSDKVPLLPKHPEA